MDKLNVDKKTEDKMTIDEKTVVKMASYKMTVDEKACHHFLFHRRIADLSRKLAF